MKRFILTKEGYIIDTQITPIHEGDTEEIGKVFLSETGEIKVIERIITNSFGIKGKVEQIIDRFFKDSDDKNELLNFLYTILRPSYKDTHKKFVYKHYLKLDERPYEEYRLSMEEFDKR